MPFGSIRKRAVCADRELEGSPMYASFFGLRELPFNNTPDPRFFFSTPDHEEALASLIYAIGEEKGFVLLTGEVGSGKTLVTRLMLRHFSDRIAFAAINNTQMTANDLLRTVCVEFDIEHPIDAPVAELTRRLQDFLLRCFAENKPVVLMLDEAQALSREGFEQIRMIGNLEADDAKLLQIVIVGQPELRDRFEANDMRQLRQRIFRSFHLSALTREQTEGYIRHRLSVAGAPYPDRVFDGPALDVIYEYSQGLPRLVNTVCDNAMLSAYAADQHTIDQSFVTQVIAQMMTVSHGTQTHSPPAPFLVSQVGTETPPRKPKKKRVAGMTPRLPSPEEFAVAVREDMIREIDGIRQEFASQLSDELQRIRHTAEVAEDATHVPDVAQLQRLTVQFRKMIDEAREVADTVRDAVREANTVRGSAQRTSTRLVEQAAVSSRLCVTLRGVFDRLQRQADALEHRAAETVAAPRFGPATEQPAGKRVLDKARNIDRTVGQIRSSVDEMRAVISAANSSNGDSENAIAREPAEEIASRQSSRLAQQVRELTELVNSRRPLASISR